MAQAPSWMKGGYSPMTDKILDFDDANLLA
jgi:hypothetical protein